MANIKSAIKRAKQNNKTRLHKAGQRSMMRTYMKAVVKAIESGDAEKAQAALKVVQPVLDKAANKGLIHKNKAARTVSRLVKRVKALAA